MSELAFNLSGERFEVPAKAAGWRVRRLKPKGAPEVVYGRSGIPLILPIDADIEDLRHETRMEGRYRLDPVDEHGRAIETTSAGYVCVQPIDTAEPSPAAGRAPSENPVIEAMRMNTELARTIIDKFPLMLESAAVLLRAADGAGMPARPPLALPEPEGETEDEDEGDEDEATDTTGVASKPSGWASIFEPIVPFIAPAIINAVTSGKIKIPGGLGALLDCRRASPKASAAAARATSMPTVAPVPGPRDPAPARRPVSPGRRPAPRSSTSTMSNVAGAEAVSPIASDVSSAHAANASASAPASSEFLVDASQVAPPTAWAGESSAEGKASDGELAALEPPTDDGDELPTLDPAALTQFAAIQAALTLQESMLARALVAELTPAELRAWLSELRELSVPDAVAKIRAVLNAESSDSGSGGGS